MIGLAILAAFVVAYLVTLAVKRTYPTWVFDVGVLAGAAVAGIHWRLAGDAAWPAAAALGGAAVWFAATRKELTLPRAGDTRVRPGDKLPAVPLTTTSGATLASDELAARGAALIVLYRGWWCPYCVTQLGELERDYDAYRAAGLAIYAISVDPPEEQAPLETRLGGRVTFLSDAGGALVDALGVRHADGVPWYDRLLVGAPRRDIAMPLAILVDRTGVVRYLRRSRRIDERPPLRELLDAAAGER